MQGSTSRHEIMALLEFACKSDTIVPYYQGIYDNDTKTIDKYEALLRLVDERGVVHLPHSFLPIAKQTKHYAILSRGMIAKALRAFRDRTESISLNVSLLDLESEAFQAFLLEEIQAFPEPARITLELLETEDFTQAKEIVPFLEKLRAHGCMIASDDFGAGYASMASLFLLRPDFIKIDGSIVQTLCTKPETRVMLEAIRLLADALQAKTIAEYVENAQVQAVLQAHQVEFSQGFYFSVPKPIEQLEEKDGEKKNTIFG